MVFLMSILVFLAGIMTYMFFPRNDQFQINMYEEEGNIVTFLNQHQAAKDYLFQMIQWNPTTHPGTPEPYGFTYDSIDSMMPSIMRGDKGEVTHDISNEEETENPNIPNEGYFTSAVVCLDDTNQMTKCPTDKQYVMTYGYTPHWWSNKTNQKQVWLKSMLKRSHGSDNCGILEGIGEYYAINNGQKYGGIVKAPIGGKMQKVLPDTLSKWIDDKFTEDRDILICLSSIKDVYKGTPLFHWDSINNGGIEHTDGIGTPLVGSFEEVTKNLLDKNGNPLNLNTYTISGVINGNRTDGAEFLYINGTQNIKETCTNEKCTLSAGDINIDVPLKTSYAFVYTTAQNQKDLTVYYSKPDGSKIKWTKETKSSSETSGPVFSSDAKLYYRENNNRPYLLGLRIYDGILSKKDINHNIKADRKRFGL